MSSLAERPSAAPRRRSGLDVRPLALLRGRHMSLLFVVAVSLAVVLRALLLVRGALGGDEAGYALDAWRLLTGRAELGPYHRSAPGYVQALSAALLAFGGGDLAARLLSALAGVLAVVLCAPLARLTGRATAVVAALALAVSPYWVDLSTRVAPDGLVVVLGMLSAGLVASRHLWPWSLVAASALAGYLLSCGVAGVWMTAAVLALLVWLPRRGWRPATVLAALASFAAAMLAGLTTFFARPAASPLLRDASGALVSAPQALGALLLGAPGLLLLLGLLLLVLALSGRSASAQERGTVRGPLVLVGVLAALLAAVLLLPAWARPAPSVLALLCTWAGAWLVVRALQSLFSEERAAMLACLGVAALAALTALAPIRDGSVVTVPGGARLAATPGQALPQALERVRRVSLEVYRLERSRDVPMGGRRLSVAVSPQLANWGLWYLRDLERVDVAPPGDSSAEVEIAPTAASAAEEDRHVERVGVGAGAVSLAWQDAIWDQIKPEASRAAFQPKPRYDLLDAAPPGDLPGQLNTPAEIATDPEGNVYVVDQANSRVQKYGPDGKFLLQWGEEGEGEGRLKHLDPLLGATGIAASDRFVWVADTWNHRIQQFRPDGGFVRAWGEFKDTRGERALNAANPRAFYGPRGVALGPDGLLYITDTGNGRVVVYRQDGRFVRQWGSKGAGAAQLDEPVGIAVDRRGTVYVADARNERVQVFSGAGRPLRRFAVPELSEEGRTEPYLDIARDGAVYLTTPGAKRVLKLSPQGAPLGEFEQVGDRQLLAPVGIAVGPDGEVYVVDSALGTVVRLDESESESGSE